MSLEDLTADDHEVLDDLRKLTPTDMGYIVCRMSPILRDFLISLVDQSSDAARQEGARGGKPVAWSRTDTIRDAEGRGIGMDEPETHYGATPPDDDGGAPWYPMYASPAEPSGWRPVEGQVDDLAALVRALVHHVPKDKQIHGRALDYLARHGLAGSPLRTLPPTSEGGGA